MKDTDINYLLLLVMLALVVGLIGPSRQDRAETLKDKAEELWHLNTWQITDKSLSSSGATFWLYHRAYGEGDSDVFMIESVDRNAPSWEAWKKWEKGGFILINPSETQPKEPIGALDCVEPISAQLGGKNHTVIGL